MKKFFFNSIRISFSLFILLATFNLVSFARPAGNATPPHLTLSISIPAAWQSQIVRQDFENESIFSLKTDEKTPAFLFSVTKVTDEQWMTIKNQVKNYSIIENKDGFITFIEKTDAQKIKGNGDMQYQQVLPQIDGIISTIHLD
jgi:hypothetical protein